MSPLSSNYLAARRARRPSVPCVRPRTDMAGFGVVTREVGSSPGRRRMKTGRGTGGRVRTRRRGGETGAGEGPGRHSSRRRPTGSFEGREAIGRGRVGHRRGCHQGLLLARTGRQRPVRRISSAALSGPGVGRGQGQLRDRGRGMAFGLFEGNKAGPTGRAESLGSLRLGGVSSRRRLVGRRDRAARRREQGAAGIARVSL
jgi:hypothetical protein